MAERLLSPTLAKENHWRNGAPAQVYMSMLPLYACHFEKADGSGRVAYHVCRHANGHLSISRVDETGAARVTAVAHAAPGESRQVSELQAYAQATAAMSEEQKVDGGPYSLASAPAALAGSQLQSIYDGLEALTGRGTPVVVSDMAYSNLSASALKTPLLAAMREGSVGHRLTLTMVRAVNTRHGRTNASSGDCTVLAYLVALVDGTCFQDGILDVLRWLSVRTQACPPIGQPYLSEEDATGFLSLIPEVQLAKLQLDLGDILLTATTRAAPLRCSLVDLLSRNPVLARLPEAVEWVCQNQRLETTLGPLEGILGLRPGGSAAPAVALKSYFRKPTRLRTPANPTTRSMHLPRRSHA